MASKWTGVITNGGNDLIREWVNGKKLNFDGAATGTGTVATAGLMAQTALVSKKQEASVISGSKVTGGIKLKLQITAPEIGYKMDQYGVWASLDGGESVMIALFQHLEGVDIPSKEDTPDFVYTFYALISTSNTGEWSVTVDASAVVTLSTLKETASTTMPKMDGTASVGTEAAFARGDHVHPTDTSRLAKVGDGSDVTAAFTRANVRENIVTGEKLSVLFGKIAKWFADLGSLAFKSSVGKADLATDVQTSLGKADSALQSYTETDPTVPSWAKAAQKPSYTAEEVGALSLYEAANYALKSDLASAIGDAIAASY